MGVKSILRWAHPKGVLPSHHDEERIQVAIESLLGKQVLKEKTWVVKLNYLRQTAATAAERGMKDMWFITFSESPDSCFLYNSGGGGDRMDKAVIEASVAMMPLLEKKAEYRTKISVKFEGKRWKMGDFAVKLGAVTQTGSSGPNFRGHMVEVEYTPLQHREVAEPIMKEFIAHLVSTVPPSSAGWLELVPTHIADCSSLPQEFSALHSSVQYVDLAAVLLVPREPR